MHIGLWSWCRLRLSDGIVERIRPWSDCVRPAGDTIFEAGLCVPRFAARLRDLRECVTDRDESHRHADGGRRSMGFGAAVRFVSVHDDMRRRRRMRAAVSDGAARTGRCSPMPSSRAQSRSRCEHLQGTLLLRGACERSVVWLRRAGQAGCLSRQRAKPATAAEGRRRMLFVGQEQHGHRSSDGEHQPATTFGTCGRRRRAC